MDTKDEIRSCKHQFQYLFIDKDGNLRCSECHKMVMDLSPLRSSLEPDKGYRTVPFELSEETWKKLTPIERMKFKGLLLEKIPVEPDKKSA